MNTLYLGFSHYQQTLQTDSELNTDMHNDQFGKKYCDDIFSMSPGPIAEDPWKPNVECEVVQPL